MNGGAFQHASFNSVAQDQLSHQGWNESIASNEPHTLGDSSDRMPEARYRERVG